MKLVVGLGNPGKNYERTRHNAGFLVLDELANREKVALRRSWTVPARLGRMRVNDQEVLLVKPATFMNSSGRAVAPIMRKRGLKASDLIIVVDDVELECGRLRIRRAGGTGGHKGLESVIQETGTQDFIRVRIGVGPRPPGEDLVDYVLAPFSAAEREKMDSVVPRAADAVIGLVCEGLEKTMNEFN